MLAEEKKFLSIPRAIGLFMVFKALFYRDALADFEPETTLENYCYFADQVSFYSFIILGLLLCVKYSKKLVHFVTLFLIVNLFGGIYIIPDQNASIFKIIAIVFAHLTLLFALYWSSTKIEKIKATFGDIL